MQTLIRFPPGVVHFPSLAGLWLASTWGEQARILSGYCGCFYHQLCLPKQNELVNWSNYLAIQVQTPPHEKQRRIIWSICQIRLAEYILSTDLKVELKGCGISVFRDTKSDFTWAYSELWAYVDMLRVGKIYILELKFKNIKKVHLKLI